MTYDCDDTVAELAAVSEVADVNPVITDVHPFANVIYTFPAALAIVDVHVVPTPVIVVPDCDAVPVE
jgi:hypothetical protein